MSTVVLNKENFLSTAERSDTAVTLVEFWADWCAPCKTFGPIFEAASDKHSNIVFGKVDTEVEEYLSEQFNIQSIPTVMAIREGVIVYEQPGALPEQLLESLIDQIMALDMADVKKQLNAQENM